MSRAALKSIQAASGGGPAADTGDEYWGNTVLLLDGEGTDGGQNNTFTDSSSNSHTITDTGDVSQGSFSPYLNNWSTYFENADSNITFTPSFSLGSNDFCIEFWANFTEAPAASSGPAIHPFNLTVNTGDYLSFELNNAGNGFIFRVRKSGANDVLVYNTTDADHTKDGGWVHLAATRDGNTFRLFVDGVLQGTDTFTGSLSSFTNGWIGCWTQVSNDFKGYISNLRITNGSVPSSRQTSSTTSGDEIFTPPTSNLDTVTDTVLLTCRSNRFIDLSSSPHTLSTSASPKITTFSPTKDSEAIDIETYGGSAYFDGSGDYLTASDNTVFNFGTGNFTVEAWVYLTGGGGGLWSNGPTSTGSFGFYFQGTNELRCDYYGGTSLTGTTQVPDYAWHHVAVIRSGSTLSLYLNGAREATTTTSSNNTTDSFVVGRSWTNHASGEMQGYVSDLRVVKGTALYTGTSYTVPTAPLTAVTNTSALLNFQDSEIYDLTGSSNIETVYQASVDTSVKKYGSGSIQMDGAGDYLLLRQVGDTLDFPGDFTIEFWLYTTSTGTQYMFDSRTGSGQTSWFSFFLSNTMYFYANGSSYTSAALSNYTNTWIHVAFVRSGSLGKWYINGTASGSNHNLGTNTVASQAGTLRIGASFGANTATTGSILNGYMDDFRITNGIARYTSNFTPSSEALPKF